jgi:hypothetical protein
LSSVSSAFADALTGPRGFPGSAFSASQPESTSRLTGGLFVSSGARAPGLVSGPAAMH